jgi:Icc-related predicted phosphoesterase
VSQRTGGSDPRTLQSHFVRSAVCSACPAGSHRVHHIEEGVCGSRATAGIYLDKQRIAAYNLSHCPDHHVVGWRRQGMLRLLYVTDLHGWTRGYEQIAAIAQEEGITTVVNGGDMFPHGRDLVVTQRRFIVKYLCPYLERLSASGISYYGMLGNDDCRAVLADWLDLVRTSPRLHDLTEGWLPLADGLAIGGCNYIPDPPFRLKDWSVLDTRDYRRPPQHPDPLVSRGDRLELVGDIEAFLQTRPTLEELLDAIAARAPHWERAVLVCHAPPQGTGLGNISVDTDVGSAAVRAWINQYQPLLTLHGHIHESRRITGIDTVKIGRTTVHQPGQERFLGRLIYSIVEIEEGTVRVERKSIPCPD